MKRKITTSQSVLFYNLNKKGKTVASIAREFGLSYNGVKSAISRVKAVVGELNND